MLPPASTSCTRAIKASDSDEFAHLDNTHPPLRTVQQTRTMSSLPDIRSTSSSGFPGGRDESAPYGHSQSDSKEQRSSIEPSQPRNEGREQAKNLDAEVGVGVRNAGPPISFREYEAQVSDTHRSVHSLPMDAERGLDVQHDLLEKVLDGQYIARELVQGILAPRDGPAPAILDIGTGTGTWAIAMAREFPHAEVVGIDLVWPEPREDKPPNCRFEVDNLNIPLNHYINCFDVIHCRLVDSGIRDYPMFLNRVARMLRPGGIVLLIKGFHQLFTQSCQPLPVNEEGEPGFTFLQKMFTAASISIKKNGGSEDAALQYEYWFTQNTNYEPHQTVVRDLFIPIGCWSSALDQKSAEICEMMRLNFRLLIRGFKPLLIADGHPEAVVNRWTAEAEQELNTLSVKGYSKWRFAWAVRRRTPWVELSPDFI